MKTTLGDKGWSLYKNKRRLIPGGCGTLSKAPQLEPEEPALLERGSGCRVWDCGGHDYIDFRCALGPVTLGYGNPQVDEAIRRQLEKGIAFGQPTKLEFQLAEQLVEWIPSAEAVRFLKSGGEAMAAAIRLARAATGRPMILTCGYHGWVNGVTGAGLLPETVQAQTPFQYGDLQTVEALLNTNRGRVAAVTLAGAYAAMSPADCFPQKLRDLTQKHEVLFIVDEIVTGFRLAPGGWHDYYRTGADLAVFSKGIANGMPLSALAGRADILQLCAGRAVVSSTFSGECLSLAAALAVLAVYRESNVIDHMWTMGTLLMNGSNALFEKYGIPVRMRGLAPCPALEFSPQESGPTRWQRAFFRALYREGVSMYFVCYVGLAHTQADIEEALLRIEAACQQMDPESELAEEETVPTIGARANLGAR